MELRLILDEVPENERLSFCKYIKQQLENLFNKSFDRNKVIKLEEYLNSYNNIRQIIPKKSYYSVYDIYRLALESLRVKQINNYTYELRIDNNILLPNSYTKLSSILALLEFGTLSVKKYGLLNTCMDIIAKNLTTYYLEYLGAK